jgi:uncharacterized protein YerC
VFKLADDLKAQAIALMRQGKTNRFIADETGISIRHLQRLRKRIREVAVENGDILLAEGDLSLAVRAMDLLHDAMDEIEDLEEKRKFIFQLNAIRGTSEDKIIYRENVRQNAKMAYGVHIIAAAARLGLQAPVIEGEARLAEPSSGEGIRPSGSK